MNFNPFRAFRSQKSDLNQSNSTDGRNNNYNIFRSVDSDIEKIVSSRSVIDRKLQQQSSANFLPTWQQFIDERRVLATPVISNKPERLAQYRLIAKHSEVDFCLDEIADDFFHEDDNGNVITMTFPINTTLNTTRQNILQNEFNRFISFFNFRDDGYMLVKRFMIEGELAWENIIKHDDPERGIVGIRFLPAEYYETLVDSQTNRPIGIVFDSEKMSRDIREILSMSFAGSAQVFNTIIPSRSSFNLNSANCVPLLYPQITYINSGETSFDGAIIIYPLIEKARQAYQQLALLQDAAVVLRVTRAPERLVFNLSTGKMNQHYADEYCRQFADSLKSRKVPLGNGDIGNVYNPVTMLESYVFSKSDGNDGTSVETVSSTADYDQVGDIEYFLRRLFKQFKVPFSRWKTPENTMEKNEAISYEEYDFSRMLIRYQRRFASGIKQSFITHLKLRDIWYKYNLSESDLNIKFTPPVLYDLYQQQKQLQAKIDMYTAATSDSDGNLSRIMAMKKFLGYTDNDIEQNYKSVIKEKQLLAIAQYFSDKTTGDGPVGEWSTPPVGIKGISDTEDKAEGESAESSTGGSGDESSAGGANEESSSEDTNNEGEPPPAPTFGLG